MSGIVGSKLNIRGSGLVAKLGTDGQHLLSSGAGKSVSYETVVDATYDDNKLQANIALLGFKTAVNGSLAKYNLQDQIIDEYTDATGVDASASTNERLTSGVYDGGTTSTPTVTEDADSKGTDGDYSWYKWTDTGSTGSYNTNTTQDHEWLIVAGGGSGARGGGGGGAGGYRNGTTLSLIGGNAYTVTIGAGGAATTATPYEDGNTGGDSIISGTGITTITSSGGGLGAKNINHGGDGGSGGGPGRTGSIKDAGETIAITQYTAAGEARSIQGFDSVDSNINGSPAYGAPGGGGAGALGVVGTAAYGGDGGVGLQNDISGTNTWYAGGGGGATESTTATGGNYPSGANGRTNGGGGFGTNTDAPPYANATANTGGGGGGCHNAVSGLGGSGIVILRRLTTATSGGSNLTLQSTDTTASTANPDYADMIILMENAEGTATLDTDIKGYISEDSGVTFTQGNLVEEGTWGTNKKIIAFHDLDISAQSGSAMCYKITTHNQSAGSKETKIHATSIGWKA